MNLWWTPQGWVEHRTLTWASGATYTWTPFTWWRPTCGWVRA